MHYFLVVSSFKNFLEKWRKYAAMIISKENDPQKLNLPIYRLWSLGYTTMKDPWVFYMDTLYLVVFDIIVTKLLLDQYHRTQKISNKELNFVIEVSTFLLS